MKKRELKQNPDNIHDKPDKISLTISDKDVINADIVFDSRTRSYQTKETFIAYMLLHPNERFWQSVRNFSGRGFILVCDELDGGETFDTYHFEEKDK